MRRIRRIRTFENMYGAEKKKIVYRPPTIVYKPKKYESLAPAWYTLPDDYDPFEYEKIEEYADGKYKYVGKEKPFPWESACFIATASYGTPMMYKINILRNFRDTKLIPNRIGNILTKIYYFISPPIAIAISKRERVRAFTRFLLNPLVKILRRDKNGRN